MSKAGMGRKHSDAAKHKVSIANKGKHVSAETREKLRVLALKQHQANPQLAADSANRMPMKQCGYEGNPKIIARDADKNKAAETNGWCLLRLPEHDVYSGVAYRLITELLL
jgi:hypothetical protein